MTKRLRVRVVEGGHQAVNVKVPIGVAKWGMKMAQAFSPEMKNASLDWTASPPCSRKASRESSWRWKTRPTTRPLRSGWNDRHDQ